jgi:2-phospho-L-lactate guanylyltransferase
MSTWGVIPVRPPAEGKSRLAPVLSAEARLRFNETCFRQTIAVVVAVLGARRTLVVSRARSCLDIAASMGADTVLEDLPGGLNAALTQAAGRLRSRGATGILSVSCDLPFLMPDDLRAMLDAATQGGLVIAGDRAGSGTNALMMSPVGAVPYRYGIGSFRAHQDEAVRAGLAVRAISRIGLAFDVDTPADLTQMQTMGGDIAGMPVRAMR